MDNEQNSGSPAVAPADFDKKRETIDGPAGADWREGNAAGFRDLHERLDRIPAGMQNVETMIEQRGKTAPRVTPIDIINNIASENYFLASDGVNGANLKLPLDAHDRFQEFRPALALITICVLTLRNGYVVVGTAGVASPENYDEVVGRVRARDDAIAKMKPLMGYALREKLYQQTQPDVVRWPDNPIGQPIGGTYDAPPQSHNVP